MTERPNATFKGAVTKLWESLTARHRGGNRTKYGRVPIEKKDFEAWLLAKSVEGLTWKCEYTGNVLQLFAKTQAGRLTIDHKVPLAKGGKTTLDNLAVCSEKANKVKGSLSVGFYGRLMSFIATWPEDERQEVIKRLGGSVPIYRRRGR